MLYKCIVIYYNFLYFCCHFRDFFFFVIICSWFVVFVITHFQNEYSNTYLALIVVVLKSTVESLQCLQWLLSYSKDGTYLLYYCGFLFFLTDLKSFTNKCVMIKGENGHVMSRSKSPLSNFKVKDEKTKAIYRDRAISTFFERASVICFMLLPLIMRSNSFQFDFNKRF